MRSIVVRGSLGAVVCAAVALGAGCDCKPAATDAGSEAGDAGGPPPEEVILFRPPADGTPPPWGDVPWPSDLYVDSDGTLVDEIPGLDRVVRANEASLNGAFAPLHGFGRSTAIYFLVSGGQLETDTLPASPYETLGSQAAVFIANVDPASPRFGEQVPALVRWQPSIGPGPGAIAVLPHPGSLLDRGTRYAVVVTPFVTYIPCQPYLPDAALAAILALPAAERTTPAEILYGDAFDALVATGNVFGPEYVSAMAVFTTMSATEDMVAIATAVADPAVYPDPQFQDDPAAIAPYKPFLAGAAGTSPTLDEWFGLPEDDPATGLDAPGEDNPGGIPHDAIGAVLTGAFETVTFLGANGHVVPDDGSGPPEPQGTWLVPVTFIFPNTPPPAGGWPVIVHGHGLGNSRKGALGLANELCRAGFVVAAIDFVYHGTRDGIDDVTSTFGGTYAGPDGYADAQGNNFNFFAYFNDGVAMRDNFRQTIADNLALVRLLKSPALDLSDAAPALGGVVPLLDATNLFWTGGSLGGIMGTMVGAYAPELRAVELTVPGGGFVHLLASNSAGFQGLIGGVLMVIFGSVGTEPFDSFHPVANLIETGFEPGDPLVHAEHLFRDPLPLGAGGAAVAHSVLVSYALDDETLPNRATDALMGAMGLPVANPSLVGADGYGVMLAAEDTPLSGNVAAPAGATPAAVTAAAIQHSPATHGLAYLRWDGRAFLPGAPFDDGSGERFPMAPMAVTIDMDIAGVQQEIVHFFTTALGGATPEIDVYAPPVADWDDDGVPDADELVAGTDPYDPTSF
ncbi:MAG TPA: hypothetical protein VG389_19120 [Myxococcota bacterium]|jgi:hypothetical protein|nr:hypothetical protein [Myxococcota bacterium]